MPRFLSGTSLITIGALAGFVCAAAATKLAAQGTSPPDLSSSESAWVLADRNAGYIPIPGEASPTIQDSRYAHVGNGTGAQPTFRIADLNNPNIKPWAKAVMKRENDKILAGGIGFTARSSCLPAGVPAFFGYAAVESIHFLQTHREVTMIFSGDAQVRRVYLEVPHSTNLKPSWYGESVGHYEADTLVVDTIGMNDKTYLDGFRTPHTEKLHVVERYKLINDGKILEVTFRVEDPDTFYEPWSAINNFKRVQMSMHEEACAENNQHLFDYHMPVASKVDF